MTWATDLLEKMKQGTHQTPPMVQTLQLGLLDDWGDGWVRKTWRHNPALMHQDGSMFGGYIGALFDQVFTFAAMSVVTDDEIFRTTNLSINFVSLSRLEDLVLKATVVSRSRKLITVEGKLSTFDGKVRSTATAQHMIQKRPVTLPTNT